MNSEELNPERQNAINKSIDSSDRQVIDSFVRRRQETTEALVNTFTYFTIDNVKTAQSKKEDSILTPVTVKCEKTGREKTGRVLKDDVNAADTIESKVDTKTDEDGIEEEILDEGTKSGAMTKSATSVHANLPIPHRKFGNFVDEAESDHDNDDDDNNLEDQTELGGGYCASFSQSEQGEVTPSGICLSRDVEKLPHATQPATECDLSVLVDEQYEPNEDDNIEEEGFPLNPGEIEDLCQRIPSLAELEQVTRLEITTTRNSPEGNISEVKDSKEKVCTDEVEPFKLDEDFDYDNVKLTPKFTAEELVYLKSFLPTNSNLT